MTTLFESTDAEAVREMLLSVYDARRFAAPSAPPYLRIGLDQFGEVGLHRITYGMDCEVGSHELGGLYFGHLAAGGIVFRPPGDARPYRAGDVFLAGQPDEPYLADIVQSDLEYVGLEPSLLTQVAATSPARVPTPIRFTGYQPATARDAQRWLATVAYFRELVADGVAPPLVLATASRLLAATALTVFPNDALRDPTIEDRHDAHPDALRRAVAFIDDNAQRPIGPADIAAAAHVSIRAVQLAFRRHLDTTPMAYLRRVRLTHAHEALRDGDPATTSVSAVAAAWGFADHSSFTELYRITYGQPPSKTLRGR
ncbi:helix-turn-helix transcriptional regulator [Cryptosporangium phraense]|uniref:Helix-turn-helix transcriptional regulator n=1 Tax=Cryptosporangium phraense TaxID=2593070 RepID=A0A545AZT0_9ACTN|nr:helix-turn-helix transcriptional regulator [Cryptosporangium phraense]TQS46843.1 helix-turn-helix transcriptional regulator [Cryptosporangium phraense]